MTFNPFPFTPASRWLDQCKFEHDSDRKLKSGTYVGQNLWWGGGQQSDRERLTTGAVESWYAEVKDFPSSGVGAFDSGAGAGKAIGHFTQVIWADTDLVGCGYINYKDGKETVRRTHLFLITLFLNHWKFANRHICRLQNC